MTHEPLMEVALEPKTPEDAVGLYEALLEMLSRNPPIRGRPDHETGLFVLCGDSEPELDEVLDDLINRRKIGIHVGPSQVAYLETLGRPAEIDHTYKKQTGGVGEFARVKLLFEPSDAYAFDVRVDARVLPPEFVEGVEQGLEAARTMGLLAGFKVVDFKATLLDGAFHDIDSTPRTFEIAAGQAFAQLREKAEPTIIEPVMALYVTTPAQPLPTVLDDLARRRGRVASTDWRDDVSEIEAIVPLSSLFGYANILGELTRERGKCTMRFDHYAPVPLRTDPDGVFPGSIGMRA